MDRTRIISGRLVSPTHVELDEPVNGVQTVEVIVRDGPANAQQRGSLADFIASLPRGTRSREDIDRQIAEERNSWNER